MPSKSEEKVLVQIGQCGNQLGACWLDECWRSSSNGWFRPVRNGKAARCVLVDSEPRVVGSAKSTLIGTTWNYEASHRLCASGGRGAGNNWATGYLGTSNNFIDLVEDNVRREIEKCDRLAFLVTMASASGGTGSGLGCAVAENLDDTLCLKSRLVHSLVLGSDVTVGPLNACLTLATLLDPRRNSGVLALYNDEARSAAKRYQEDSNRNNASSPISSSSQDIETTKTQNTQKCGSVYHLNAALCRDVLTPALQLFSGSQFDFVAGHPRFRLLSATAWQGTSRRRSVHSIHRRDMDEWYQPVLELTRSLAPYSAYHSAVLAAHPDPPLDQDTHPCLQPLRNKCHRLRVLPFTTTRAKPASSQHIDAAASRQLAFLGAGANLTALESIASNAHAMLQARAFLHHYERHGLPIECLHHAVDRIFDIIQDYSALSASSKK